MPLLDAKCTNCGGILKIDGGKDAAICPFCESAFVVEKAIQNFYTTNNIYAQNVVVQSVSNDFQIEAGCLVKYRGIEKEVIIPSNVDCIGERCFEGMKIVSVKMPNSVKSIEFGAFRNCRNLTSVILSNALTCIPQSCFQECISLKKVNTPKNLKKIGDFAFRGCSSLTSFEFIPSMQIGLFAFGSTSIANPQIKYPITIYCLNSRENAGNNFDPECAHCKKLITSEEEIICSGECVFEHTPYGEEVRRQRRMYLNLCIHCGNKFEGIFIKKCSSCRRIKDY